MAIKQAELDAIRADFKGFHGRDFRHFICPITLRDEPCELMDGHILNEAFVTARRMTVIQRKDVDNYFGSSIERDFTNHLNNEVATKEEWFQKAKHLFVTGPSGDNITLLHASKIREGIFPKINLFDEDGSVWASGYLKGDPNRLAGSEEIFVGHTYAARDGAVLGSWMTGMSRRSH